MKTLLIGSTLTLALVAGTPAGAADIIPVAPAAPAVAVPGWTGFYVGANAGYSWGETNKVENKHGFTGGGQIGYDYQFGNFVLGLETDLNWRKATHDVTGVAADGIDIAVFHSEQNWFGTVRPRLGFTLYNLMIYGTGGFLYGDIEHQVTQSRNYGLRRNSDGIGLRRASRLDGGRRHRMDAVPMDHWGRMAPLGLRNRDHQFPSGDTGRSEFPGCFLALA
jgi:opacity protein-like surface antigen